MPMIHVIPTDFELIGTSNKISNLEWFSPTDFIVRNHAVVSNKVRRKVQSASQKPKCVAIDCQLFNAIAKHANPLVMF